MALTARTAQPMIVAPSRQQRGERLLADIAVLIERQAQSPQQHTLLSTALHGLQSHLADTQAMCPFLELPFLIHGAVRGTEQPARMLAVATACCFLGIDIMDDLADGDGPAHWNGYRPAEVNLAAFTLLATIPQIVIATLDVPPARRIAMQQTLAEGLLRMSAGQQRDLRGAGSAAPTVAEVEAAVIGKSGEECATFAAFAAQYAGADDATIAAYADMGRALGTAGQFASDCFDLFHAPHSRDLANGTRTLPIALYAEHLPASARADFFARLAQAQHDPVAQATVRTELLAWGGVRRCAFVVELYCQRALRALEAAQPLEPAASRLRASIQSLSFFSPSEGGES